MNNVAVVFYTITIIEVFIICAMICVILGLCNHVTNLEEKLNNIATKFQLVVDDISQIDLRTDSTYTSILETKGKIDKMLQKLKK